MANYNVVLMKVTLLVGLIVVRVLCCYCIVVGGNVLFADVCILRVVLRACVA